MSKPTVDEYTPRATEPVTAWGLATPSGGASVPGIGRNVAATDGPATGATTGASLVPRYENRSSTVPYTTLRWSAVSSPTRKRDGGPTATSKPATTATRSSADGFPAVVEPFAARRAGGQGREEDGGEGGG